MSDLKENEIHYHVFDIVVEFEITILWLFKVRRKKFIGYKYMKCGYDYSAGFQQYPEGLPQMVGVFIPKIGKFGYIPKKEDKIEANRIDAIPTNL